MRAPGGGVKETVIAGDKVTEGDKTLVPLFSAYGREPLTAADGKPLLVDSGFASGGGGGAELAFGFRR